jgi:hypothetical protein
VVQYPIDKSIKSIKTIGLCEEFYLLFMLNYKIKFLF